MPSLKSLMSSNKSSISEDAKTAESQAASAGVIRLNLPASFNQLIHVEGHPDQLSKAMMQHLRADLKDFQELAWHFNEDAFGADGAGSSFNDTASRQSAYSCGNSVISGLQSVSNMPNSAFYNVQRLLRQEKGEDVYYALAMQKRDGVIKEIQDKVVRQKIEVQNYHYTRDCDMADANARNMEFQFQDADKLKSKREEHARTTARVIKFEVGRSTVAIRNVLESYMHCTAKVNLAADKAQVGQGSRQRSYS